MSLLAFPLVLAVVGEEPATLFGHEVTGVDPLDAAALAERRAQFERGLAERNWIQIGDQIGPAGSDGGFAQPIAPASAWEMPPHRATIFLNFFGTDSLSPGTNAALDESSCLQSEMAWPGFAGTEQQALALIDVFEVQMAPYGVRIAYDVRPPPHLPYAMVMMGGSPQMLGLGGGVLGVSCSSDCGDLWWRDTTFAFTDAINPNNAEVLGTTALHEAAHAFGLAHIGDPSKIMNPFVSGGNVTWGDACIPYDDATGGINCIPTHDEFCSGGAQNSAAELLAYFGENSPDVEPPTVEITAPADGTELEVGGSVMVEADISDDHEGAGWRLVIPEAGIESVAYTFEKGWPLGNLPEGVYTLRVEAIDHDRNEGSDEVVIYVGVAAPGASSSSGADSSGEGGAATDSGGETSDDPDESGDDSTTAPPGQDDGPSGCGCRSDARDRTTLAWATFLALAVGRRRRAQSWPPSCSSR